jgi:hypothetical protein
MLGYVAHRLSFVSTYELFTPKKKNLQGYRVRNQKEEKEGNPSNLA